MSAHTKGPWWVSDQDVLTGATNGFDVMRGEPGTSDLVCVAADLRSRNDAHLIAAAPDLLAALEVAHSFAVAYVELYRLDHKLPTSRTVHAESLQQIDAAIAKARGSR